jgi:predicted ATPase
MVPTLPVSLHELLLSRLEELPIVEQDVLRRAAVMGGSFPYDGLVVLCRKQFNEKEVTAALDQAVHFSFLNRMNDSTYQFDHSLMQETIYETLSYAQRQQWHTQYGDWLVAHQPDQPLEIVAYHYLRGNDGDKAAQFGCRAGDKARRRGVLVGALEYYEQVLALPDIADDLRMHVAEGRADVLVLQGDYSAASAAYAELHSTSAAAKKALLSGDLSQLTEIEFKDGLRPWVMGAQAWLLAQTGQTDAARIMVDEALSTAGDHTARPALQMLGQKLTDREDLGAYEEWLGLFARGYLDEI